MHDEPDGITLAPGETKEPTHTFATPGQYLAGCHVPGHYPAGMKAVIDATGWLRADRPCRSVVAGTDGWRRPVWAKGALPESLHGVSRGHDEDGHGRRAIAVVVQPGDAAGARVAQLTETDGEVAGADRRPPDVAAGDVGA